MTEATKEKPSNIVTMTDGREVEFHGKKTIAEVATDTTAAEVVVRLAFSDGEYRTFTISDLQALTAYAGVAAGIVAMRLTSSKDFDAVAANIATNPAVRKPRAQDPNAGLTPLHKAVMEVTGVDGAKAKAWLESKSRAERAALRKDPRVGPVLLRIEAEIEAAKAAKKGETAAPSDALAGLLAD